MTRRAWLVLGRALWWGALSWVGLASCLATLPAHAHLGQVLLRAQRYLKIDASEEDTRLVVSLSLGASEAARVLEEADTDGDRVVSQIESDVYMAQWGETLATDLPIELDGAPLHVEWTEGYMDPIGPVSPTPLTVEITAHLPVSGREHVIRYRDRMRREVFDLTEVAFRAHDGAELVSCGPGESPPSVENDLSFSSPGEAPPEVLTARVRYPGRSDPPGAALIAIPVAVVSATIALVIWRRRRR